MAVFPFIVNINLKAPDDTAVEKRTALITAYSQVDKKSTLKRNYYSIIIT